MIIFDFSGERARADYDAGTAMAVGPETQVAAHNVSRCDGESEEEEGGSCELCGERDAVDTVNDSDPSVGYYSYLDLCSECLRERRTSR